MKISMVPESDKVTGAKNTTVLCYLIHNERKG